MRQEHLFCAEVYHRLYSQIDHDKDKRLLFCLDGEAAKKAFRDGDVESATLPDLCFTFAGAAEEVRIEAKIMKRRRVKLGKDQRTVWGTGGAGQAVPHLWIGADDGLKKFWLWCHSAFSDKIAEHAKSKGPILVFGESNTPDPCSIDELVERIVAWAVEHGFKPKEPAHK